MKLLRRSRRDQVIGGVCGGFGEYFNVDPVFVRVAAIVLTLIFPGTPIAYIILWIVMPRRDRDETDVTGGTDA
jgi:phage shock protein C